MSLLSSERLLVSLAPEAVALVRVRGLLRRKLVAKRLVECDPSYGARPWDGALKIFQEALSQMKSDAVGTTVVLSNRFVRYAVVPYDPAVSGPQEELALARFHFTRIYGERAKGWELRLSEAPGSRDGRIACALDEGLVAAIRACFPRAAGPRLKSIQPYFMAAHNQWRSRFAKAGGWLVLLEPGRAFMVLASPTGWHSAQTARVDNDAASSWLDAIERERLRARPDAPRAALVHGGRPAQAAGWKLERPALPRLEGYSPLEDARFTMALCAL